MTNLSILIHLWFDGLFLKQIKWGTQIRAISSHKSLLFSLKSVASFRRIQHFFISAQIIPRTFGLGSRHFFFFFYSQKCSYRLSLTEKQVTLFVCSKSTRLLTVRSTKLRTKADRDSNCLWSVRWKRRHFVFIASNTFLISAEIIPRTFGLWSRHFYPSNRRSYGEVR